MILNFMKNLYSPALTLHFVPVCTERDGKLNNPLQRGYSFVYRMIALFPGLCVGGHKPGNEANHEKVTSMYVPVCVCVSRMYVCV